MGEYISLYIIYQMSISSNYQIRIAVQALWDPTTAVRDVKFQE